MIDIVIWILTALDIIIAVLLIPLILVQQSKDGGFGSAFGGMGESVFGVQAANHLTKLTVILASGFLIVTLSLTVITGHRNAPKKGILEKQPQLSAPDSATAIPAANTSVANTAVPVATTAAEPEGGQELKQPDGTIVKKVPGGTITMKPVEAPAPPIETKKIDAPAGTVTVGPVKKTESTDK